MNRATLPALTVAVLAMAGCASQGSTASPPAPAVSSSAPARAASSSAPAPAASSARGTPVQGGDPAAPQTLLFTCTLGWQYYNVAAGQGGTIGPFHPGPAPSASSGADKKPADAWQLTVDNGTGQPVTFNWVSTTFYLHGKSVGAQNIQSDTSQTLNPGQSDDTNWSGLINPLNEPAATDLTTGFQIENQSGASCAVTDWGNATGQ